MTEPHDDPAWPGDGDSADPALTSDIPRADPDETARLRGRAAVLSAGTVVGQRYRLITLLATDSAGHHYWKARDTVLPRDMAVTVLPDTGHTSAVVTRTLRVGRLNQMGLPQTLDVGAVGQSAYVASQWPDGMSVTELLGSGPLEPQVAATLAAKLAAAVAAIHQAGIALGAIHPSLVRVNIDGQVRLSHATSRAGAEPVTDVRALGGLLYLMLTGTWPLDEADAPDGMTPAAFRRGRAVPATSVSAAVPQLLASVAERALYPDHHRGIRDVPTLIAELRSAGATIAPPGTWGGADGGNDPGAAGDIAGGAGGGAGGASAGGASGTGRGQRSGSRRLLRTSATLGRPRRDRAAREPLDRRERAIQQERRIKLSIAGAMLLAMAVLIVITFASLSKQVLASIVAPINASDHQELVVGNTPTTTRTVGTTQTADTSSDASSSGSESSTSTSSTPKPVTIADATVYDPQGDGNKDYTAYVDRAFDGDPSTFWLTWVYQQQFGPGGIKDGVGLLLRFDHAITPASVTVSSSTPGTDIEIRSADSDSPALDSTKVLGKASLDEDPVSIGISHAEKSEYLLVWVTKLGLYSGGGGGYQSNITEISVTG